MRRKPIAVILALFGIAAIGTGISEGNLPGFLAVAVFSVAAAWWLWTHEAKPRPPRPPRPPKIKVIDQKLSRKPKSKSVSNVVSDFSFVAMYGDNPTLYVMPQNHRAIRKVAQARIGNKAATMTDSLVMSGLAGITPEPYNVVDSEAIYASVDGRNIGYFANENKAIAHRWHAKDKNAKIYVIIRTNPEKSRVWFMRDPEEGPDFARWAAERFDAFRIELDEEPARHTAPEPQSEQSTTAKEFRGYTQDYMTPDIEEEALKTDENGIPSFQLAIKWDRIVMWVPDIGLINPGSRMLWRHKLCCFRVRGSNYYQRALFRADYRPGQILHLRREPKNKHDKNAIAVAESAGEERFGYVNRQNAKRLAPLLDAGEDWTALSLEGSTSGQGDYCQLLIARTHVMEHLLSTMITDQETLDRIKPRQDPDVIL